MNITLTGTKITQDTKFLAFEKNNGVDVINITVDTDESWTYKLDVKYPNKCCSGEQLYNIINLTRIGNTCTAVLTKDMLPFTGKYIMQLRGISGDKVYHSDTFDCWVKYSIEPASTYDPVPSEFYQIEDNITEINNNPPKPGENGYWLVWDITTHQYKESAIPLPDGTLPNITADTSGKYLSNDGKKAYWAEVQTGEENKIDAIEVNGVEQPIVDKTVNISVPTKTSDISNDSGYITNEALNSYATKAELPTKVSQLENDSKFINESALDGYAKTVDIPTKTSQLNNDSGYITVNDIPVKSVDGATGDVVTNAVKTTAQTLTNAQQQQARINIGAGTSSFDGDYNSLTNKPTIPTKTSDLTNDSGFITESDVPVKSVNGKTGQVTLDAKSVGALPDTTTIPTKTSELDNDSDFITSDALADKQDKITGAATTITNSNLTANCALISDANGKVAASSVTSTELGYINGITSNVQTQLDSKAIGSNVVYKTGDESISGVKTFEAPENINGVEQTTTKFTTSNGGAVIIGKEGSNSGTMLRLDQVDGTTRLRFRASAAAGAMIWEQPEHGAQLYIDLGDHGTEGDYRRIKFPTNYGTLALQSDVNDKVPKSRKINGYALSANINLTASDVGALPADALPTVTTADNGKVLCVVDGKWAAVALPST